ncbi:hypothetical protein TNCV_3161691 [Trichonephila clavipes]|nr:hypothetical protein TNCV_3161691 [Trichonephila clavipes]
MVDGSGRSFGCGDQWGGRGQTRRAEPTNGMGVGSKGEPFFRFRKLGTFCITGRMAVFLAIDTKRIVLPLLNWALTRKERSEADVLSKIAEHIILLRINHFITNTNFLNLTNTDLLSIYPYHPCSGLRNKSRLDFREADPLELSFWTSKRLSTGSGSVDSFLS